MINYINISSRHPHILRWTIEEEHVEVTHGLSAEPQIESTYFIVKAHYDNYSTDAFSYGTLKEAVDAIHEVEKVRGD